MIIWVNNNSGFVMCILTLIYVATTFFIFFSNKNQVEEAHQMREDAIAIQKQNVALQLLDKKLNSYYRLQEWVSYASLISKGDMQFKDSLLHFHAMVFNNTKDKELLPLNNQIRQLNIILENETDNKKKEEINVQIGNLSQTVFMQRCAMLVAEIEIINQIQIFFPGEFFNIIEGFCKTFTDLAINIHNEINGKNPSYYYSNALKDKAIKLSDERILDRMWDEIKDISISGGENK